MYRLRGFTLVELLIVIVIIGVLVSVTVIGYNGTQQRAATATVRKDLYHATDLLNAFRAYNRAYPSNLADTSFAASDNVAVTFYTNSDVVPQYQNLSADENAQLFLNACNGSMPIVDNGKTLNTACVFAGINIHVPGKASSNVVWHGKTINQSDITLSCGSACDTATQQMITLFTSQGGTFPIYVPANQVPLPAPTLVSVGSASRYCLEARSSTFVDIIFHTSSVDPSIAEGACPNDPALHYP